MIKILIPALFLLTLPAIGQVAIIKDEDGYTNVRKSPDSKSEIVQIIYENKVFWFNQEEMIQGWVPVLIPQNDFSFSETKWPYVEGFIHQSRLMPLNQLDPYKGDSFSFEYLTAPFDSTGRTIGRVDGFVEYIDGRHVWGTDGAFPKVQVVGINVAIDGKPIEIHPIFYRDLFECKNLFKVYRNGNTWFVQQLNSDGAGAYELVWVFSQGNLKQRLVGRGIY